MAAEPRRAQTCGVAVIGLLMAGTAASPVGTTQGPRNVIVTVENLRFNPEILTVRSGDRVTWMNKDLFAHTATADDKTFDSHGIAPAASWTFVAGKAGTYTYSCTFHPTMKGTLKVQ